jgi:hypothetical protein
LGHHYRTNKYSINNNYDTSYTFFRERASRPKVEISPARDVDRIGFRVLVQRNGIPRPSANCNRIQYNFERQNHNGETAYLQVNTPYFVYPFAITHAYSIGFETCKELAERIMNDDVDNIKFEHHAPREKLPTSGGS